METELNCWCEMRGCPFCDAKGSAGFCPGKPQFFVYIQYLGAVCVDCAGYCAANYPNYLYLNEE